ncbi:hypothetical protein RJT34_15484 [Clitoria ternatea]|uniref:Uncharacterized protein n=1 Tax=Clitoria ternatea TaxID=43366 RepID=A0AAN9J7D5_CLITE
MAYAAKRYAIVTGGNKGIGFEVCKQLASNGITVLLTARDEKRGLEAVDKLKHLALSDQVVFHQLDVTDPASISSLANFIKTHFGKLDILVNNAGIRGANVDHEAMEAWVTVGEAGEWTRLMNPTYESVTACIGANYYGAKNMCETFIPLLKFSDSPRIVNVSSTRGNLELIPDERAKGVLNDVENLTEEKLDELLNQFLEDFKEKLLETKSWTTGTAAYTLSKAALNAYTRILAKKYPTFYINAVCPGYCKTDLNYQNGYLTVEEGAQSVVRYAVVTGGNKGIGFEVCKQLASNGITVLLTARDEKRGLEAVDKLQHLTLSDHVDFHQLDVTDPDSISSFANFIKTHFGKLDILVNNAAIPGARVDEETLAAAKVEENAGSVDWSKIGTENYELSEVGVKTNYYGTKELTKALIPLLQFSGSPKIVNVSASLGRLEHMRKGWPKDVLSDVENLTEEKIDEILSEFLKDYKEGSLETKGWPLAVPAYSISKVALNAYTRILAKKYPSFCINAICPGYVKTDLNYNSGFLTPHEGAEPVVRLSLLPHGSPSGLFFCRNEEKPF